ncbi:MAG TPA: DUF1343 domain-containing protein, partial [bacterium]|nr:DUF1343 domain-containing protein [bacterium]
MRYGISVLILLGLLIYPEFALSKPSLKLGLEVLLAERPELVRGKHIGLITNQTGVDSKLKSNISLFLEESGINLVALFAPEHGIRGERPAGEYVESYTDEETKLPVYSLYGKTRKPTKDMLKGIDLLIFDMQDVGVRHYTYISTMALAMESAKENNIEFMVLDRP